VQGLQVAQPALALLDVGLEEIARPAVAAVPVFAFGQLGLDELVAGALEQLLPDPGAELVERAGRTWMIPVRVVTVERDAGGGWTTAMAAAVGDVLSG